MMPNMYVAFSKMQIDVMCVFENSGFLEIAAGDCIVKSEPNLMPSDLCCP